MIEENPEVDPYFEVSRTVKRLAKDWFASGKTPKEACEHVFAAVHLMCDNAPAQDRTRLLKVARLSLESLFSQKLVVLEGQTPPWEV